MLFSIWFRRIIGDCRFGLVSLMRVRIGKIFGLDAVLVVCKLIIEYLFILQINDFLSFSLFSFALVSIVHLFDEFPPILVLDILLGAFVVFCLLVFQKFGFLGRIVAISLADQQNRHQ